MDYTWNNFKNYGFVMSDLSDEKLQPIKDEINNIRNNFDSAIKYNKKLGGYIEKEFELLNSKKYLESIITPLILGYDETYQFSESSINILTKDLPLALDSAWVNFQKKNEFNPIHSHSGIFSFVIWINIPYNIDDERNEFLDMDLSQNNAACFNFHYINILGNIETRSLPVDKTFENKVLLFPSKLNHSVNPFRTSDDYRISVSGNFKLVV